MGKIAGDDEYDVVVLGTGAAGLTAAVRGADGGARVGLFERAGAATIRELARLISVPADALQATVDRWSGHAAAGADPDFHRGESHHDRAWGDPAFGYTRRATIGPLDTPPYYVTRVRCGTLGTKGGPRTDAGGRVLDVDGAVIDGSTPPATPWDR